VISGNVRVCFRPEWISRYKDKIGKWWVNEEGREAFDWLYREIRSNVERKGGWPGDPDLEIPGLSRTTVPMDDKSQTELPEDMKTLY